MGEIPPTSYPIRDWPQIIEIHRKKDFSDATEAERNTVLSSLGQGII